MLFHGTLNIAHNFRITDMNVFTDNKHHTIDNRKYKSTTTNSSYKYFQLQLQLQLQRTATYVHRYIQLYTTKMVPPTPDTNNI